MDTHNKMGVLVIAFVVLLLGAVLISTLGDQIWGLKTTQTVTDDQFTASNTTCTRVTNGCVISITSVENATGTEVIGAGNYSICRSTTTGLLDGILLSGDTYIDGGYNGGTINATYANSPDCMYISDTPSKTVISLVLIFFAVSVVVGGGIYLFNRMSEDWM